MTEDKIFPFTNSVHFYMSLYKVIENDKMSCYYFDLYNTADTDIHRHTQIHTDTQTHTDTHTQTHTYTHQLATWCT